MRKLIIQIIATVILLALVYVMTPVEGVYAQDSPNKIIGKYENESAFFFAMGSNQCANGKKYDYSTFIIAGTDIEHAPPGPPTGGKSAIVYASYFDCDTEQWVSGYAEQEIKNSAFKVNGNLKYARLKAPMTLIDWNGETHNISVDVSWASTDSLNNGETKQSAALGSGCEATNTSTGSYRESEATGSISAGATTLDLQSMFAAINSSQKGQVELSCE
jgi:hypothetical protein